ncbi:probable inorganic phosphate transporter 1-10 [Ananas comosus]|uniref:H(+)/Pi cotransporter n=1 Tax=Ananas comosus TaxID=4615 RepID=A0A6P5GYR4_ANACO|nr:probable inorganic phosphate transporter 1-10 [Ananas comosus]
MALKVLTALDHARTQYYHFKAIVIAGMGLFTDSYDFFCVSPVMTLIGRIYYSHDDDDDDDDDPGVIPPTIVSTAVAIALLGAVVGQLVFGALGDRVGRRRVYGICLVLMVASSFACGFSICRTRKCVLTSLCFFRFMLGVGIGGDYPLSATIMSEFANKRTRGSFIAAVFSMQGFGILASSGVTMAVTAAFDRATKSGDISPTHTPAGADLAWRIILMIGAVPAALTFYWRMAMPETARFTALVEHDVIKATTDMGRVSDYDFDLQTMLEDTESLQQQRGAPTAASPSPASYGLFSREFLRRHGRNLFACAAAWLIVDIPYYSSTLFQSRIYKPWFPDPQQVNAYQEAYNLAKCQAIIAVASAIPGYFASVYFIDRIGRRCIQMLGFAFMALFLFALAGTYNAYWHGHASAWFITLYALTFFFSNFGPNTTTFIIPAELFPARFRSTCHGISGASGKVGAIIGAVGFLWASQDRKRADVRRGYEPGIGIRNALIVLGAICVVGLAHTYVFTPETKMRSLEENEKEKDNEGAGGPGSGPQQTRDGDGEDDHEEELVVAVKEAELLPKMTSAASPSSDRSHQSSSPLHANYRGEQYGTASSPAS